MRSYALAGILLGLLIFAGCTSDTPAPTTSPTPSPTAEPKVAPPALNAAQTLQDLRTFSSSFPYRQAESATHVGSRDWLEGAMKGAGLEVVRHKFASGTNIIGIKWGADRERWIVVGAHYDITEGAVFGTYDDGSGTIQTVRLAQAYAKVDTHRTLAFILFDQEERGLVGSRAFVKAVTQGNFQYDITIDSMIDLDMVGILHPHPAKLVAWQNSPEIKAVVEEARKAVGIPDEKMAYRRPKGGSSDGASFIEADIPTIYFWSNWDEVVLKNGQPYPSSYPWWHQADTYETMLAMAGDEATLTAGFQNILDIVSQTLAQISARSFAADTSS